MDKQEEKEIKEDFISFPNTSYTDKTMNFFKNEIHRKNRKQRILLMALKVIVEFKDSKQDLLDADRCFITRGSEK